MLEELYPSHEAFVWRTFIATLGGGPVRIAAQIEQARPWADRRPPIHA